MMKILIVAAVDAEIGLIRDELGARPAMVIGRTQVYTGLQGRARFFFAAGGIGVVTSAAMLGALVQEIGPDRVLMIGSAGAYPGSGLAVGNLAVASSETMAELGLCTGVGIADAGALGLVGVSQQIELDAHMTRNLMESCGPVTVALGGFLTVAGVSADPEQAATRAQRFGALLENMEGFAVALVGQRFRVPVAELRAVSNSAGDRDKSRWDLRLANERAQQAALAYLRRIS